MKPRLILVLGALLALTGCSPEPTASPPTGTPAPTAPAATRTPVPATPVIVETAEPIDLTPEDIAGITVELWHAWDGDLEAILEALVADFNAGNEYDVQVTAVRRFDLQEEVARALAAGEPPDLAFGFSYHVEGWSTIAEVADWNVYLADPAWGLSTEELADFYPEFLAAAATGGAQTGLPFYRTAEILLYNSTWAGELGFASPPSTPDDLTEQACAANAAKRADADPGNDGEGGLMLGYEPAALVAWMSAFGGGLDPLAPGEAYAFDRPENVAALVYLRSLLDQFCAWLPEGVYPHDEFAGRRGLLLPSTAAGLRPQAEAMAAAGSSDDWIPIPYPASGAGLTPLVYGPDLVLLSASPERRLAAWVFARWLLSPENLVRWSDATGYLPVRRSVQEQITGPPIGFDALLDRGAMFTPPASWVDVQWAVSEMARMLFSPFTPAGDAPALAAELDAFAEELHQSR